MSRSWVRCAAFGSALILALTACSMPSLPNLGGPAKLPAGGVSAPEPVAGHPRLFVRETDLARLRSWATPANTVYADGLAILAATARADMDEGRVPAQDGGQSAYERYPTEWYAELFAFMSLIEPDQQVRNDYGKRARDLLMYVIEKAEPGIGADGEPFRDPRFATFDRSRWHGDGFGLTLDWAYPYFSAEDKARVRKVFLRWAGEQFTAYPAKVGGGGATDFSPAGPFNDPALLADRAEVRWAMNNYFAGHLRNLGLMALAIDPADDPDGALRGDLRNATGQWLYQVDHVMRSDAAGGLSPEGTEYALTGLAYVAQFLVALHTAGEANRDKWGPQVVLADNPFFGQFIPGLLHSMSPVPVQATGDLEREGQVYLPAAFGDLQRYLVEDQMPTLGPLALYAADRGDRATIDAVRWFETEAAPGGRVELTNRVARTDQFLTAIMYFLVLDPAAPPPADPRPTQPLVHRAAGLNRYFARTCWCPDARWFTYSLTWKTIDHQGSDGNEFEFYRRGEWLTKQHSGYDTPWYSDYHNTLTIQNDPGQVTDDRFADILKRGSQEPLVAEADPKLLAQGQGPDWFYALGDSTNLYNSTAYERQGVTHASRSIVWLQPDHVVIYDRAETRAAERFKRFWLQLTAPAAVAGNLATVRTPGGQQLFSTTLLPTDAVLTPLDNEAGIGETAKMEPTTNRLQVEAPGGPASTRFLHVIQGTDGGAAADPAIALASSDGTPYAGAAVAGTAAVFPVDAGAIAERVVVTVPAGTTRVLVTGLAPNGSYQVTFRPRDDGTELTVAAGGASSTAADAAGVLTATP